MSRVIAKRLVNADAQAFPRLGWHRGAADKRYFVGGHHMRFLAFIAITLLSAVTSANADTYTAELDTLASKSDLNELIMRVNQPRNPEELRLGLEWLRDKSISGFGGSRIHYSYAFGLFGAGVRDTSAFAHLLALLTGRVDAARCKDSSALGDKLQGWDHNLAQIFNHFLSLGPAQRKEQISLAVAIEEKHGSRAPDTWLCSGGLSYMVRFFEKHKNNPNPPAHEIQDPSRLGRTIIVEDPDIKPEFVADEEWNTRRKQLVAKFVEQLSTAK